MDHKSPFRIRQKYSLRKTIFWAFVAVILIPMLLIGSIVAYTSINGNRQVVESKLLAVSALKEAAINRWLNGVENRLTESGTQNIAARTLYEFERRPDRAEYLANRFRYDILAIRGNSSDFDLIFLIDADGTVKASTNQEMIGSSYSGQEIFERGLENTYIHPLTYDNQLKQTVLYISTPVNSAEGEVVGVLAAKVNLQVLEEVMLATVDPDQEHPGQSESYLTTQDGTVLQPNLSPRPDAQHSLGISNGLKGQSSIAIYPNYAGVQVFGSYKPVDQLTAVLLVEQPLATAFQVIIQTAIVLAILSVGIIALTLYGAYRLTNLIVNPIQDLTQTAASIAGGNLNKTINLDRKDEIGVLAQAFNQMTARLRDLISTLEFRVERRTQALQTSAKVSQSITGILERDELLLQVCDLINKSFGYYYVQVLLKDDQDYLITRAGSDEIGEQLTAEGYKVKLGDHSLVGQAALGKYQVIADAAQDPNWQPHPLLTEIVSELALPIRYGDAILGVLDLQCCKVKAFSDEDIPILQSIADQLAIAVRNVRLFQESEASRVELEEISRNLVHQRAQLQTAIQVSNAAIAITDPQDLVQQAVDLIKKHFNFYYVGLFLIDDQNQWAVLTAGTGQAGKEQLAANHRLKLNDDSMIAWSIIHRQARITGNVQQDAVHYINPYLPETQSEMALPLISRDEILGAISVQSTQENAFSEEDISVLQSVADQIAIALQNSQFLSRIQTIQARFEGLYHRAPTGYHTMSANGLILEINDTELAMLGREGQRQKIINRLRFSDFLTNESKAQYQMVLERLREGQRIENLELLCLHQDDHHFPILMTAAPNLDEAGKVREIYVSVQDISQQKEIEAARENLLKETETLYNLSQELLTVESREGIYQVGINAIKSINPSRGVAVFTYNHLPTRITPKLVALWQNPRQEWPSVSLGVTFSAKDLGVQEELLLSGDTFVSFDASSDEQFTEASQQILSYMQVKSIVAAPIWSREMVTGFILAAHSTSTPFTETDIRLIEGVARQMSISMDNLSLFQETLQRAAQLEIAAEVAKNTTTEVNLETLLPKVVDLLEDSFGYYHTAIFLVDEYRQYAVVEAAAGRGTETLFTQKYKLPLNVSSQVGSVIEAGSAKITPDVTQVLNYLEHPLLPDTRSELTLPLIVHGKVIGALDIQSDKPNDFQAGEDVVLQTIADQLANAIYVARLFARELAAAQEIQNLHKHYLQDEWETFLNTAENEEKTSFVILPDDASGQAQQADAEITAWVSQLMTSAEEAKSPIQRTFPATDDNFHLQSALISPLVLRDTPLGALGLIDKDDRQWTEDDLAIIEAISAQAALAIENARLIEETQRWALEQQQVAEKLREVDKLKTQFLANMSHELRTPLNSIIGFSRVILKGIDGPLTELQKADLSSIYQSGKHLLDLINNILDLAKIEAGKVDLNFAPIDLNNLLKGLASTAVGLVKDKEIKIINNIVDPLPVIEGDDVRIRQIFLNLISNSAKFTQKGSITFNASYTQTHVSISISDTGIGISPEDKEYIFDEFTQVDASTTRQAGGTGLGLPITRKFIELHHGQIIVESELHRGSTFTVVLPIHQPDSVWRQKDELPTQVEQAAESQAPPTLLVIDGDARVTDIYRQYLKDKNFHFVSQTTGDGAVAKANELQPYAILLDVLIPDADGWGILGELKENPGTAHIPIIIGSIVDDKFRANQLGAAEYLLKPIIKNDLLQAIERLEEHKKNLKQVLVIDDNAEDILLIKRILRAHECQIIEASNGLDGLDIIYRNPPSLIVLDLTMPDLDGFGVLESLRDKQKTKNIPVIVITARELTSDELKFVNRRANALLLKGKYTDAELLQCVDKFLGDNS